MALLLKEQSMQRAAILTAALLTVGLAIQAADAAPNISVPKYITAAVADSARPAADTERDTSRKPAETLSFAGVKPGDWVLELAPGKGYYTRLLSAVVGPRGQVTNYILSQPPKPGSPTPPVVTLAADPHYSNVKVHLQRLIEVKPTNSFDIVWTTQNYHDFHNVEGLDVAAVNRAIFAALKPGGIYFVLDHAAEAGSGLRDTNTLHRIDEDTVKQEVKAAGFELVGESNLLRNKDDPHTGKVFDGAIQGHTDQFILKFRKPRK
jgi:predicted methyltransferase